MEAATGRSWWNRYNNEWARKRKSLKPEEEEEEDVTSDTLLVCRVWRHWVDGAENDRSKGAEYRREKRVGKGGKWRGPLWTREA